MEFRTAGVIGAGAWGTALAQVCARAGLAVTLQAREAEVIDSIAARRVNEAFLPGVELDPAIRATSDVAELAGCDLILAVPPAQHMRATLAAFAPHARREVPIVLCSKGIERGSLKLMTEVLSETLPEATAAVLSGPSFAAEVARGLPSAVTLACADPDLGQALLNTLSATAFRPYLATDLIGDEAGGADTGSDCFDGAGALMPSRVCTSAGKVRMRSIEKVFRRPSGRYFSRMSLLNESTRSLVS